MPQSDLRCGDRRLGGPSGWRAGPLAGWARKGRQKGPPSASGAPGAAQGVRIIKGGAEPAAGPADLRAGSLRAELAKKRSRNIISSGGMRICWRVGGPSGSWSVCAEEGLPVGDFVVGVLSGLVASGIVEAVRFVLTSPKRGGLMFLGIANTHLA
jgi:hypothetical protein